MEIICRAWFDALLYQVSKSADLSTAAWFAHFLKATNKVEPFGFTFYTAGETPARPGGATSKFLASLVAAVNEARATL